MKRITVGGVTPRSPSRAESFRAWSQTVDQRIAEGLAHARLEQVREVQKLEQPTLIVRLMPAVYRPVQIAVRMGEPAVCLGINFSFVQHPDPFHADGVLKQDCRELIIKGALEASANLRLRMCIQWTETECTYVEPDGGHRNFTKPPQGGLRMGRGQAI